VGGWVYYINGIVYVFSNIVIYVTLCFPRVLVNILFGSLFFLCW
jgi:hypothetical protein